MIRGTGPFTRAHVAYVAIVGAVSLAAVVAAFALRAPTLCGPIGAHPAAFLTFALLATASRMLAFRIAGGVMFSLDTGVYVAALLTLGVGPGAMVVFTAMLVRGAVEAFGRELVRKDHWPLPVALAKLMFGPSVTAAVMLAVGFAFNPAALFAASLTNDVWHAIWQSAAIFGAATVGLILIQFSIVMVSYRLNGMAWRRIGTEVVWPGLLGELAFAPIGFALAIAYKDADMRTLGALAVSYVIFNYVFKRMWESSEKARERADELAVVEEAGRAAASTLDVEEVGRRIGRAIIDAIDGPIGVVLTVGGDDDDVPQHFIRAVDRDTKPEILDRVISTLRSRHGCCKDGVEAVPSKPVDDVLTYPLFGPDGSRRGYLSVALRPDTTLTERDERILQSICRQASIAVENWRLYSMATEDGLTGLFIRRYVEARLAEEFERSARSGGAFCVLMIDVDNLKTVNDIFGHAAGDTLLREVGVAIRESVRLMDVPGRWGGDEFAALLLDMKLEDGMAVARRMSEAVRRHSFRVGSAMFEPSVSIGVAACPENGAPDALELVAMADRALYAVKRSGNKGSVVAAAEAPRKPPA